MYASFLTLPVAGRHSRALHLELLTVPSTLTTSCAIIKLDELVKSRIPYSVHASTGSARTEYQWVTPFTLSADLGPTSKGERDFLRDHQTWMAHFSRGQKHCPGDLVARSRSVYRNSFCPGQGGNRETLLTTQVAGFASPQLPYATSASPAAAISPSARDEAAPRRPLPPPAAQHGS